MQKFVAMSFYITVHISFIYFVWIYTYMLLVNEEKSENRFNKDVVVLKIKRVNYITYLCHALPKQFLIYI